MGERRSFIGWGLLAAACCAAAVPARAGTKLTPRLALEVAYDDNIFLQSSSTFASSIVRAGPAGVVWKLEGKRLQAQASYDLTYLAYSKFPKVNNALHHGGYASLHLQPKEGVSIRIEDAVKRTTDPASSELTQRAKRFQNDLGAGAEFPLTAKTFGGVQLTSASISYSSTEFSDILDRGELLAGLRAGWKATAKTRVYAFARLASVTYTKNIASDAGGTQLGAGLEGDLGARWTGKAELGSMARSYSKTRTGATGDLTVARYALALTWKAPADVKVSVNGERGFQESVFNRFYTTSTLGVSASKPFGRRVEGSVLASFGQDDYPDAVTLPGAAAPLKRKDTLVQAGVSGRYSLREDTRAVLRYLHRSRASNLAGSEYADNVIGLSGEYNF